MKLSNNGEITNHQDKSVSQTNLATINKHWHNPTKNLNHHAGLIIILSIQKTYIYCLCAEHLCCLSYVDLCTAPCQTSGYVFHTPCSLAPAADCSLPPWPDPGSNVLAALYLLPLRLSLFTYLVLALDNSPMRINCSPVHTP